MTHALRCLFLTMALVAAPAAADRSARVDKLLASEMQRAHIPALAVAVLKDGKLVKLQAYGTANLEAGAAATVDTPFQIASATKLFTSVLLMDQVAQGRIDLDAPVSRYLPEAPAAWADMRIRHLAAHASGLPPTPPDADLGSVGNGLSATYQQALVSTPGATNAYGSNDFTVLAAVLERVSGQDFRALLQSRISDRLALPSTRFDNAQLDKPHIVLVFDEIPGRAGTYQWVDGRNQRYAFLYPHYTQAAGGLFSSISDMAGFVGGILDGRLLDDGLLERMWAPVELAGGKPGGFAIGWTVGTERGHRRVGHSGGPALADVAIYPDDDVAVIVLGNQRSYYPILASEVARLYLPGKPFVGQPAIIDDRPEVTRALSGLVAELMQGRAAAEPFADSIRPDLALINRWLQLRAGHLSAPTAMELVGASSQKRSYRTRHGDERSLLWHFDFDAAGKITNVDVGDE